jgi:dihydrofolate reductase
MPLVSLIAAVADNGVIGRGGALPWRLPEDLRRFKAVTLGKPILMGRRTWLSLGRPLPGRENLVLSRDPGFTATGASVVHSLEDALARCAGAAEIIVIGGAEIYELALPLAHRLYLTRVHGRIDGDTYLPGLRPAEWRATHRESWPADTRHAFAMTFETLERVAGARDARC